MGYLGNTPTQTVISRGLSSQIAGLTYANSVADATNDIDIALGSASDSGNADILTLSTGITKQLDAAWAVGTNAGGLDTGSIGNSDYYIHLIKRVDTGVVDVLFSLSSTAPTMPTNYTLRRLIGWFKRVGATIVLFHTYEAHGGALDFAWDAPTLDVNLSNTLTTSRRTDALKVPLNFSVLAFVNMVFYEASGQTRNYVVCPDVTDVAPSTVATPLATAQTGDDAGAGARFGKYEIRTSSTGTIAARSDVATVDTYQVVTLGFQWSRRSPL